MISGRKLKIAQVAPLAERVPPKKYGGIERVVHALTEELTRRGHDVTLFASGDSSTSARLVSVYPRSLREAKINDPHGLNEWLILHLATAYKRQYEFDIIHDHNSILSLPAAQLTDTPTVMTIHGPITQNNKRLYETVTEPHYVTISRAQAERAPTMEVTATVLNGLPLKHYPFGNVHKGFLLFVGRISMEKGVHHAIDVSQHLSLPLVIAAKLDEVDTEYFDEYIRPRINGDLIRWIGEVDEEKRNELMSEAMCLLHPVTWREPFGLTMIEAMACGCPVIAFNKGSIPEIVDHGRTGYVVNDVEEMIDAVSNIEKIDRKICRDYALEAFSAERMTDGYEAVYRSVLYGHPREAAHTGYSAFTQGRHIRSSVSQKV